MNNHAIRSKALICLFALILLFVTLDLPSLVYGQQPGRQSAPGAQRSGEQFVSIDFNNVDINVLIKFISELSGKNFVVDQRVKGKVTIISPAKISVAEAYKVFESVLEVHGFSTVEAGEVIKIIPSPDARSKNIETRLREEVGVTEDKIVTQLIPLKYADPGEIKKLFAPLISKSSVILDYPPTNMLIVTDVYSNIQRLLKILDAIDVTGIGHEISLVWLNNADANNMVKILSTIFLKPARKGQKGEAAVETESKINFVADERTNSIILIASEVDSKRIKKLISMLDKETPRGKETFHVYYLENADAEELAKVLQDLPTKKSGTKKDQKTEPVISADVKITADKATNSLIIMAEKEDYQFLEQIIQKLDIPRSMVYIECLIMEVDVEKDFVIGTEWLAMGQTAYKGRDIGYGGGFSGGDPGYGNIGGVTQGQLPAGFSMGMFTEIINIGGVQFPNLAAIVQAFQKDKDVHILATPQILTTNNEEAKINVGKNVAFQTRSAADSGVSTYSSFEYRDVGNILQITPHISQDRTVRLKINYELSKLDELATSSPDRPTTLKRAIETVVLVKDKSTVVIGGLIDEAGIETTYKVPCLGDIPLLGWAFKTRANAIERTNLFVFITPKVVQSPDEANAIFGEKRGRIDMEDQDSIKMYQGDQEQKEAEIQE
ncbi:type II secretion system secretin GspD [Thermodesulfobacteriota bacterium]